MFTGGAIRRAVAFAALFAAVDAEAQERNEVALAYLQRHGVPCLSVAGVDSPIQEFDLIATCHDGRRWGLSFFDGEVAFLHPATGEPYRWRRDVYEFHPEVYVDQTMPAEHSLEPLAAPEQARVEGVKASRQQ
jgi:hypothetical protein